MPDWEFESGREVVIGQAEATITVGEPAGGQGRSGVRVPLRLHADNLSVDTAIELEEWGGGVSGLISYFEEIAAEWQSWMGAKQWRDDGPNVSMSGTHDGVGTVKIEVSAAPFAGWDGPGSWEVKLVLAVEPGSLDGIATRLRRLFGRS